MARQTVGLEGGKRTVEAGARDSDGYDVLWYVSIIITGGGGSELVMFEVKE